MERFLFTPEVKEQPTKQIFFDEDFMLTELPNRLNVRQVEEAKCGPISPLNIEQFLFNSSKLQN